MENIQIHLPGSRVALRLWQVLTRPHPRIIDPENRRQSSLLAGFLVAVFITSLVGSVSLAVMGGRYLTLNALTVAQALLIVAYALNRVGRFRIAAFTAISVHFAAVFLGAVVSSDLSWLFFAPIIVILSTMLLPFRWILAVSLAALVAMFALALLHPLQTIMRPTLPSIVFLMITTMLLVYENHRTSLERERQQVLRQRERRFQALIKNSSDVITVLGLDGKITFQSSSAAPILNLAPEGMIGRNAIEFIHPEDRAHVVQRLRQAFEKPEETVTIEFRVMRPDGSSTFVEAVATNLAHDPLIRGVLANVREINERKAAEIEILALNEELRQRSSQLKALNEIGSEIAVLRDLNSTLQIVLERLRSILPLDAFFVLFYDAVTNEVTYPLVFDNGQFWEQKPGQLTQSGLTASVIKTGQPGLLNRTPEQIEEFTQRKTLLGDTSRVSASILMAPLPLRGKIIGTVSAQSYALNAYTQRHLDLLVGAANQIAIAVDNARLYDSLRNELAERQKAQEEVQTLNAELNQRVQHLRTLNEVGRAISTVGDLNNTLQRVFEKLRSILMMDAFIVLLYDARADRITYPLLYDDGRFWNQAPEALTLNSATHQVLQTGLPHLINRTPEEIAAYQQDDTLLGNRTRLSASILRAPLLLGGEIIGVVSAQSYTPNAYDQHDLSLLVGAANQIAIAVDNARLYDSLRNELTERQKAQEEVQTLNAELEMRVQQLKGLNEIGREISILNDLNSTLHNILERLQGILPLDFFYAMLYNELTERTSYPILYDNKRFYEEEWGTLSQNSLAAVVIRTGQPALLNRTVEEAIQTAHAENMLGDRSKVSASIMMAPLPLRGKIIGIVLAQSYAPNAYDQRHLDLLVVAAQQIAIAIDNARLYDSLRNELAERQKAQEEIQKLNAELESRVQRRTAELEATNAELEAFAYSVSHDLRAPLRAIEGFSRIIARDYAAILPEQGQHYFSRVRHNVQRMDDLIHDLLLFSRASRTEMHTVNVDMFRMVGQLVEDLKNDTQIGRAEIMIGPLPACQGDPALLKQVWANLLSNAIKYSRKRDQARVEIGCRMLGNMNAYYIRDNGTGFDMQYVDKLFEVFQRLHSDEYEGTGVGLAIVRRIVQRHSGRVWAEAAVDQGATFFFTIPETA